MGNYWVSILLIAFTLNWLSYILFVVLLSVLFLKSTKNGAVVYSIRCFLCSRVALQHLSVGSHLATRSLSQCLGRQELAALKHHAACFQALLGCSLCLPTLPFRFQRRITFAMNSRIIRELHAYNGNIKGKPALCEQQSLLAANEEKEWVMSERCIKAMMCLREKRVGTAFNVPHSLCNQQVNLCYARLPNCSPIPEFVASRQ